MTTSERPSAGPAESPPVEVRRSKRRRRTVQAYMRDDTIVVLLPARMTKAEERYWVAEMVGRLQRQEQRRQRRKNRTDADLLTRARDLSGQYLDGRAQPTEVRWVTNQNDRWGSCTPALGSIRLSDRLRDFPNWVSDYVLLHELTHLLEPGHGPEFWRLVNRYPKTERARGFLEGVLAAGAVSAGVDGAPPSSDRDALAGDVLPPPVDPSTGDVAPAPSVPDAVAGDLLSRQPEPASGAEDAVAAVDGVVGGVVGGVVSAGSQVTGPGDDRAADAATSADAGAGPEQDALW